MSRKLTIAIDDAVYDGLRAVVGRGRIGAFLEDLARPLVVPQSIDDAYAAMALDRDREDIAMEWCESLVGDCGDAAR